MRVNCLHGYFIFKETYAGEVSEFMALTKMDLSLVDDYFTFSDLVDAKNYSVAGNPYLSGTATKTCEGRPWQVMRKNGLVYDFKASAVVPIIGVTQFIELQGTENYFLSGGLILPGSVMNDGSRVTDYSAWFNFDLMKFKYSDVTHE